MRVVATASDEHPFGLEYRIVRADGEVRWVLDRGQLVAGVGGRLWMDGVIFDVTERRAAEEALRRREIEEARTAELQASRARIVAAADAARRRIERDLHDGAQQQLVALALELRVLRTGVKDTGLEPKVDELSERLAAALADLRELARGIHPAILTDRGLAPAIGALAERGTIPIETDVRVSRRLAPPVEAAAYFLVAEALTNVSRYAHATWARVEVAQDRDEVLVLIADDGVGGVDLVAGSGLRGLQDRLAAVGGTLSIDSPPGAGTRLHARIPCP
jgi:signal transduction histidine kinase